MLFVNFSDAIIAFEYNALEESFWINENEHCFLDIGPEECEE